MEQMGRTTGLFMLLSGIAMASLSVLWVHSGDKAGWIGVGIGAAMALCGAGLTTQRKLDVGNAPIERLIRVRYDQGVIDFEFCPFYSGFARQVVIEHYECPMDEIRAFDIFQASWRGRSSATVRIWTSRGYLSITGAPSYLDRLARALRAVAGDRPAPFFQRQWVLIAIEAAVAFAVLAVLWHFFVI